MRARRVASLAACLFVALLVVSCDGGIVYDKYKPVDVAGWWKDDTVSFSIPPLRGEADYREMIGIRISNGYLYSNIGLIVQLQAFPSYGPSDNASKVRQDTIEIKLFDDKGNALSTGITHYTYQHPLTSIGLSKGDSLQVKVWHNMRTEMLAGVDDVGFIIYSTEPTW